MKMAESKENAPRYRKAKEEISQGTKDSRKIHVSGFPLSWKNSDIENFFKQYV